ncbi:hypothetical protein PGB34_09250 [Xenophilus arseniciresistens]|uniref:DUF4175 domain-containing protein n=1 Tax=Xenophilus arseniciresistens TaxID=1283306 RepID=A0AAE3SYZ2_9BURK|nr:hypothetical protein [Xenophilus arseniciresistens]MDA7416554.1 hypothetical protein [Xenophilus arseniciresistens]
MSGVEIRKREAARPHQAARSAFWRLWGWPLLLGLLTLVGLSTALFSDAGVGDWLAWVCLGVPALGCVWWGWLRRG